MTVIDHYLKNLDPLKRKQLERIRNLAKEVVTDAEEVISYGMPTLKYKGKSFLGFNAHKNHIGIYPYGSEEIELFKNKLIKLKYGFSSGAIRIPYNKQIPETLLKEIINYRLKRLKNSSNYDSTSKKGVLITCSRGHKFYKSTIIPVCPICWPGKYKKNKNK